MLDKNLMVAIGLGNLNNIELFTPHQTSKTYGGGRFGRLDVMSILFSTKSSWVDLSHGYVGLGRSRHGATPLLAVMGLGVSHVIFPAKIDPTRRVVIVMCKRHALFVVPKL